MLGLICGALREFAPAAPSLAAAVEAAPGTPQADLEQLFASIGAGDHLILGVSDNVPPDANLTRLEAIKQRVAAFGPVGT